jgi:hypothetical protein
MPPRSIPLSWTCYALCWIKYIGFADALSFNPWNSVPDPEPQCWLPCLILVAASNPQGILGPFAGCVVVVFDVLYPFQINDLVL